MISLLIKTLAARLRDIFDSVKVQTMPFAAAPDKKDLPGLAIYPGKLIVQQAVHEAALDAREVTLTQQIALGDSKTGPYLLNALPKVDSVSASLIEKDNPPLPLASSSFKVDYDQATISFPTRKTATGDLVMVEFISVQILRQREFQQELWLEAYAASEAEAEKWAGVACSVILNSIDDMLVQVNSGTPNREKNFSAGTLIRRCQLIEGLPIFSDTTSGYRLKFQVTGDLRLIQMFPDNPAVIKEVVIDQKTS